MIKKEYNSGDNVWIHGVSSSNKLTKGTVITSVDLSDKGFTELQYIISIPTHIEPLLEVRTWHTMSQDDKGPIGSMREIKEHISSNKKKISQLGFYNTERIDDIDPTPEEIMAALEKSTDGLTHKPLNLKDNRPKKRFYKRKKQ